MTALVAAPKTEVARFRAKLLVAMMLVVATITAVALYLAQRNVAAAAEQELQREFQGELAALHNVQELRQAALLERCRALVRRPRIHAAIEDDALDLLYPSARDELRDLLASEADDSGDTGAYALHAEFYRFLDRHGAVITPSDPRDVGSLLVGEQAQLALPRVPDRQQLGYVSRVSGAGAELLSEVIAMPVVSTETGEVIAALALGFKPAAQPDPSSGSGIRRGIWLDGTLHLAGLAGGEQAVLTAEVAHAITEQDATAGSFRREIEGAPYLLFYKRLNPGSLFPAAYEVCLYPLAEMQARQARLRWQVLGAAGLLLLVGYAASHPLAVKLSQPVEKLAVDSAENRAQRERAEAALESTSAELQRAARFSADASHQLKTPVTVMRAGLEDLLAQERRTPEECHEIAALIHQTYRLSGVIEDLLLLSRMDAGRLKIDFAAVDLAHLIATALDDLGAQPDATDLKIETEFPADLTVAGEKRYLSLILQNLLENARKYNRPAGRIRIAAREEQAAVVLTVGNTGNPIPPAAQAHIFERFHRGAMGENVPGYGLGLNLARELARLHGGDLRLMRSDGEWTEFEVRFQLARMANVRRAGEG